MRKILTIFITFILVAGIVSVAKATDVDSSSNDSLATAYSKDRHIVKSSNGTIVVLYSRYSTEAGLRGKKSTDGGNSWKNLVGGTDPASTEIDPVTGSEFSICMDASDNIYVAYQENQDIYFRKLTYNAGNNNWQVGAQKDVDINSYSCRNPSIIRDSDGKVWVAYGREGNEDEGDLRSAYATDPYSSWDYTDIWPYSYGTRSALEYEAALVIRNGYAFAVYNDRTSSDMLWSECNGTSWSTPITITGDTVLSRDFSVTTIGSDVHLVYNQGSGNIYHMYYNGSEWSEKEELSSIISNIHVNLTTDDTDLWCFISEYYGPSQANIKYKKWSGGTWDVSWTAITTDNVYNGYSTTPLETTSYIPLVWMVRTPDYAVKFDKSIVLDTTPPGPPENVEADPLGYTATNLFSFSWTAPYDESGINHYHYSVNSTPTSGSPSTTNTSLPAYAAATQQGENTFYVVAEDNAENINYNNWGSCKFYYDTTKPTTPGTPSTTTPTNDTTPTWNWTASTDAHSGLRANNTYRIYWDTTPGGTTYSAYTDTNSYTHTVELAEGTWYVKVCAYDAVNNESDFSGNGSVLIDTTDPGAPTGVTALPSVYTSTNSFSFEWTAPEDASGIDHYHYSVNSVPTSGSPSTTNTSLPAYAAATQQGENTFYVVAEDNAENINYSNYGTCIFKYDTTKPTTPGTPSTTTPTNDTTPDWNWTASTDAHSGLRANNTYRIYWDTTPGGTTYSAYTDTNSYTHTVELAEGTWYVKVCAYDAVNNESDFSGNGSVVIDATAPAAITDLSGQYSTGDVILSWSTPGDDGWNNTLADGSQYIINHSSYSIQWSTSTYDVEIATSGVAPHTEVSHTITGLQQGTTWYFQIWTRDEVPNWSGLSNGATVWIPALSQTYIWDEGGDYGDWDDPLNWNLDQGYPNAATDKARINLGSESINTGEVLTIGELELGSSYSGTLTLGGNFTLDDSGPWDANLTISTGTTLYLAGYNLTLEASSTFSSSGTLKLQGGETLEDLTNDTDSGTVEYVGNGDTAGDFYTLLDSGTTDYYHLTINSTDGATDTFRPDTTNLTVAGNFTLSTGTFTTEDETTTDRNLSVTGNVDIDGTFTANSSTITVSGNWDSDGGTFTYGTSTVDLKETGTVTVTSSWVGPFYNLTCAYTDKTTTLTANSMGIRGILTVQGGTLTTTGTPRIYLHKTPSTPISIVNGSTISVYRLQFRGPQTVPAYNYGSSILTVWNSGTVTQGGDVTCTGLWVHGDGFADRSPTWNTGGYTLTINGGLLVGGTSGAATGTHTFNAYGSTITVSGNVTLNHLDAAKAILNLSTSNMSVAGNWTITNGSVNPGTSTVTFDSNDTGKTITSNGQSFASVVFDSGDGTGGWTLQDALTCESNLQIVDGKLIDTNQTVTVNGDIIIANASGRLDSLGTGTWIQGADGNISNPYWHDNKFKVLQIAAGVTSTRTAASTVLTRKLILGANATLGGSGSVTLAFPGDNDFIDMGADSSITGGLISIIPLDNQPKTQKAINTSVPVTIAWTNNTGIQMTGDWTTGNLLIFGTSDSDTEGEAMELDTNGNDLTVTGSLTLGRSTGTGHHGKIIFSTGTHSITQDVLVSNNANTHGYFDLGSADISIGDDVNFSSATVTAGTSTVTLNGSGAQTVTSNNQSFYNLTINNTGTSVQLEDNLDVNGNLTISAGTLDTKSGENNPIYVAGNWTHEGGTFECNSSTVTFDNASSTSTLTGSTTFYGLVSTASEKNVKVSSDTVVDVTGYLNFENITLRSTLNGATWYLNLSGSATQDVSGVNVRDSNASGGETIVAFNSIDSGNNTKWDFGPPAAITDLTGLWDSGTSEVTLSWSTPGDDGWNYTLVSGSKYIIDHSSYSIAWSTNTYDVEISTSGVAPYTEVSRTITGLQNNTTWYFQIWTQDEVSRWSGLSNGATVWVGAIVSSVTVSAYTDGTPDVPPIYTQSTGNCLGTFKFEGGGTITGLTITEYGTCDAENELEYVKLYKDDGDGDWESGQDTQLGSTTDFNSSDEATFSFSLAASTYCYVHVILDVKSTADSGGTVGIELYQNHIVCTSTTTAASWPVQLGTSIIGGETTPPSFDNLTFRSQNSTDVWITASEWNDDLTPNTRVDVADTGSGLRIGSSEVSPDTHTVLLLHLNNNTTDYSGHGNNGTREGGVGWISTDTWKTAVDPEDILYFAGDNDYVDVGDFGSFEYNDKWSVSTWIKTGTSGIIIGKHELSVTNGWILEVRAGVGNYKATAYLTAESGVASAYTIRRMGSTVLTDNVWHHVVFTYNGSGLVSGIKFYIDGAEDSYTDLYTGDITGGINTTENVKIGARGGEIPLYFNGLIDEVRILDRVLSADEIAADYYSGLFKYSTNGGGTWNPTNAWSTGTVTGENGSTSYETIHASNVPFNQYSKTENQIKFLISDMNGNIAESSEYIVMIGSITVSAYTAGTPDVPPTYVYTQSENNCLGTFRFEGGGTITGLTITEYGTCDANSELNNVELFKDNGDGNWNLDDDTTQLGLTTNFTATTSTATFTNFSLAASTYCYVHVVLDVKSTADSGGTVGIELYQNHIVCTSTTTASSWPVQLGTSIIGGETTPPSFDNSTFRSQKSDDTWIDTLKWNDDLTPNTRVDVADTGSGLRIGSSEVSPDTHTVLLLHLNLNDTTDYSGHGNHGTREGGVYWISTDTWKTIGGIEDILSFDGSDDYVEVTDPGTSGFDVTDEITISAWVRFNDIPSKAYEGIVTKDNAYILMMNSAGNGFVSYLYNGASWMMSQDTGDLSMQPDVWYHVAMTFIDGSYLIYKDGQIASQDTDSLTIDTNNNPVLIGTDRLIANRNFNGMIDEVRILDRALTADEIAADYYSGLFKYSKDGGSTWYSIGGSTVAWSTGTVTGENGSTIYETIHASNVPFNQYSGTENKIKFLISDMQGNIAVSSPYTVMIGSITVSAYTDGDPDVPPSTIGKGTTGNCLGTFKFYRTGTITQLTITEYGTCDAENELEYVKLFEDDSDGNWESGQDTTQLGSTTTFSGTSSTATFSGFSLAASTYCYVHVVLDVKSTAQVDNTIGIELYQNHIVCTSTTTASNWPVQLSSSTIKDLTPPAAITDLTGLCDSDTGDVTLSWSTPGDDGWNNTLASGSQYIIDHSSYSIQWSTENYKVGIPTHSVAPHTQVSRTITGLQQETTWYFQIWTRDEVANWSGLSNGATVWVTVIGTHTYTWTDNAANGTWTDQTNWDIGDGSAGNDGYPDDADDKAIINTSTRTINTPASALTIGELNLGGSYSGTLTLGNNLTLDDSEGWDGNLTIGAGTTLDVSGSNYQINIDGNWSNSGTFTAQSGTVSFYATASKTLSGTMTGTSAFYNLYFSASGKWTLNNDLKVTNVLNINAGELDAYNSTIELAGSGTPFLVSGTFTPSGSTVQYTSPNDTNITAANYYHLDLIDPPLETRNQKPVTSNQKELLQNLEKLKIKEIEPGKFSFKSLSGDLIEIGEEKHSPPQPYLKLNRWDGEVSLKVDIPYAIDGQKSLVNNRLRWVNHRYDVDFYPKFPQEIIETIQGEDHIFRINEEGGVEFDVTLKEKPESNVFTFPIEAQGLKFYYQPPLHPEHPTWADRDGDGKPDSFRPENTVGSYAVYHETQDKFFKTKEEAEKYKFGKAFHIYRPKVYDDEGKETWGKLNINEQAGILTVTIDQGWLDNAVYPVVIDPNFGYTGEGSIESGWAPYYIHGIKGIPIESGTANSISWYAHNSGDAFKCGLYKKSDNSFVGGTVEGNLPTTFAWNNVNISGSVSVVANTEYWIVYWTGAVAYIKYDEVPGSSAYDQSHTGDYGTWPDPWSPIPYNYKFSIYCTYTPAGGATYTLLSGTFDIDGNLTIGNSSDTMEVTADTNDPTIDLEGNFNITANSTFTASDTASFNVGGNWSNSGTFTHSTGTVTLDGSSGTQTVTSGGQSFYDLTINNTGISVQLEDDLDVNGNLTISAGTLDTKSGENNSINIAGNWTFEGDAFECNSSTVTFDNASSTSTLTGSTTFYVLVSTATGKNVKFTSDIVIGVTNHLNFENITLRSTSSGATWYLNLSGSGTQDVSGVDVRDSNASGGETIVDFDCPDIESCYYGNNTNWDFGPPAAITDLTGLCDSDTGDVTLSWSTPGDDEWTGVLSSTSEYRIDYSTDSSRQWDKGTYEVSIPTYGVTPHTEVSHTITGLTGDTTWYFQIWTADEIPRWSGLSNGATVWVNPVLSVSISTNTYDFGDVPLGQSTHTVSVITVTNEGNVNETYSLKISSVTLYDNSPSLWKSTNTTTGHNRFIFYAIFHAVQVSTSNFDSDDYVIDENRTSTADWFSDNDGGGDKQTGINVPKGDERKIWFRLDMPTSTTTGKEEKITVTITAGPE